MFLRNRFPGLGDASVVATLPVEVQKFIADAQAENPAFMDVYLTEVLALPNPLDRILKDLADAFVTLEASDFALSGLGSIGSVFKNIAKSVIGLHQKLFSGLKKGVRVVERVWHKYGNIIIQVLGAVLSIVTFGASLAIAAALTIANNMYQKKQALLKAKDASRDEQNAALAEAVQAEKETLAAVDKFFFDNQQWFVTNLGVGQQKWDQLTLDQKVGLLKTGDTGKLPPDAVPVSVELIPITNLYRYGSIVLGTDADVPTGKSPVDLARRNLYDRTPDPPLYGAPVGSPPRTDLHARYAWWLHPTTQLTGMSAILFAKENPPRNQIYYPPLYTLSYRQTTIPDFHESERSLAESLEAVWPLIGPWLLENYNVTKSQWDQLSIDEKFSLLDSTHFPPTQATMIGQLHGSAIARMDIAQPEVVFTPTSTAPVSVELQAAIDQAANVATSRVSSGTPYTLAVQGAVESVIGAASAVLPSLMPPTTPIKQTAVKQPAAQAGLFGDMGSFGTIATVGGLLLSFMQEKKRGTRRNPSRRKRRGV